MCVSLEKLLLGAPSGSRRTSAASSSISLGFFLCTFHTTEALFFFLERNNTKPGSRLAPAAEEGPSGFFCCPAVIRLANAEASWFFDSCSCSSSHSSLSSQGPDWALHPSSSLLPARKKELVSYSNANSQSRTVRFQVEFKFFNSLLVFRSSRGRKQVTALLRFRNLQSLRHGSGQVVSRGSLRCLSAASCFPLFTSNWIYYKLGGLGRTLL